VYIPRWCFGKCHLFSLVFSKKSTIFAGVQNATGVRALFPGVIVYGHCSLVFLQRLTKMPLVFSRAHWCYSKWASLAGATAISPVKNDGSKLKLSTQPEMDVKKQLYFSLQQHESFDDTPSRRRTPLLLRCRRRRINY
jgi:hypothetical protein